MELKKIDVISAGKIQGFIMACFGFIIGCIWALFGAAASFFLPVEAAVATGIGLGVGILAVVGFTIMYGIFGFLAGLLGAWLYNFAAGKVGGIKLDLQ